MNFGWSFEKKIVYWSSITGMLNPVCKVGENVQEQCFFNQAFKIHFDESNITIGTNKIHSQILQYTTSLLMNCM